jgi:hypothetical protein
MAHELIVLDRPEPGVVARFDIVKHDEEVIPYTWTLATGTDTRQSLMACGWKPNALVSSAAAPSSHAGTSSGG